jgi:hypothetical protein
VLITSDEPVPVSVLDTTTALSKAPPSASRFCVPLPTQTPETQTLDTLRVLAEPSATLEPACALTPAHLTKMVSLVSALASTAVLAPCTFQLRSIVPTSLRWLHCHRFVHTWARRQESSAHRANATQERVLIARRGLGSPSYKRQLAATTARVATTACVATTASASWSARRRPAPAPWP